MRAVFEVGSVRCVFAAAIGLTFGLASNDTWRCSSDAGCQLNGLCVDGICRCDPQWVGVNCSRLNLGASTVAYSGMQPNTSTWGGHPIYDPQTKLWHGYFAEMTNHCELNSWTTNSITVHAVSTQASGPYKFVSVVQPAWSHNPLVSRDPATGDILIAHIGCGKIGVGKKPKNCTDLDAHPLNRHEDIGRTEVGGTHKVFSGLPPCECPHYGQLPAVSCQNLQILRSGSGPDGPWIDETVAWPLMNTSQWPSVLSNPTLLLPERPGQVTLLGFNGNMAPPGNVRETSHAGILVSHNGWQGPYALVNVSKNKTTGELRHYLDWHGSAEDQVLFRDKRGHVHMLMHGFYDEFQGAHGWSTDPEGINGWEFSATPAYTLEANLDGKNVKLSSRQRPQVLTEGGQLTYLFNGAQSSIANHGRTFSMVTEICAHGTAIDGRCPDRDMASNVFI